MILFISPFEIINVMIRYLNIFLGIATSVANAAAGNPNGIKKYLANGLSIFSLKPIQFLVTVLKAYLRSLPNGPKSPPNHHILCRLFENFILGNELLVKDLQSFETCVLINNNLSLKLFSLSES